MRELDYRIYRWSWKENLLWIVISFGAAGLVSWLFYRSIYGMAGILPLLIFTRKAFHRYLLAKRKRDMLYQFGEMLQMVSASLKAGYSMENAFVQGWEEYAKLYGEKTVIAREFGTITHRMKLNEPLEPLVEDFALRSGIDEIVSFSQVFVFVKRSGGDMRKIFQNTVEKIRQKAEVEREITTVVTAKRMEQRIMNVVPFGILLYVGTASPEFLAPLYGNLFGAFVMTVCLLAYLFALVLAEKILDIPV